MTHEFLRAVQSYDLSYGELKRMARQALEHSFLPGASLWKEPRGFRLVEACAGESPAKPTVSAPCRKFLDGSERARVQWKAERDFANFEQRF